MSPAELEVLASRELQAFVLANESKDEKVLVLKDAETLGVRSSLVADQISGRKKAKIKLPAWYQTAGIVYPPSVNVEQSSSEVTARFKADLVKSLSPQGQSVCGVDLCCGFGVDSTYMGAVFTTWDCVDSDEELLKIAQHNHQLLGANRFRYHPVAAEEFIKGTDATFDWIFVDPSRRSNSRRVFGLADSSPNLVDFLPSLIPRTNRILVKASPLFDLRLGLTQLSHVDSILVVAVDNECKEVLFLCSKVGSREPTVRCVNLSSRVPKTEDFIFTFSEEKDAAVRYADPLTFLYEPNAAILKAGAFKLLGKRFDLLKLQVNTHLFTSDQLLPGFPGRIFRVENRNPDRSFFKDGKVNVVTRNYPLTADQLKKKLKLIDGGETYLIGFSGERKKFLMEASRLK